MQASYNRYTQSTDLDNDIVMAYCDPNKLHYVKRDSRRINKRKAHNRKAQRQAFSQD